MMNLERPEVFSWIEVLETTNGYEIPDDAIYGVAIIINEKEKDQ